MVFVGDEDEINNTYRKSHRVKRVTIFDSFSHFVGFAEKWITKH
jgi:hypothetical protein